MPDLTVPDLIRQEATKQGVPPELALSVAEQESSFNPTANGPDITVNGAATRAIGTFQLLPETAKTLGVDPHDPVQNISGGVKYLRQLLDQHQGDLSKVLATYGGVRTNQTYVPGVLARMEKYKTAEAAPPPAPASKIATPPPTPISQVRPSSAATLVPAARKLYTGSPTAEQMTPGGPSIFPKAGGIGEMIAGGVGAAAASVLAPELALPALLARAYTVAVPLAGAYAGGAAESATHATDWPTIQSAGRRQLYYDVAGQAITGLGQAVGRRVMASGIGSKVRQGLLDALDSVKTRMATTKPAVTPSQAGKLVHDVATGPAKTVKDTLGEAVGETANAGPAVPVAPLKARLDELAAQITPMASHETTPILKTASGDALSPELSKRLTEQNPQLAALNLPPDHPLPKVLDATREALTDQASIPFEDLHKIKRLLDDAVNWDSPAKKQVQQITKGFRQTVRESLSAHEPYNQATTAYGQVAKLYDRGLTPKLHKAILDDPEMLVRQVDWQHPTQAKLLKDLTVEVPKQADEVGAQQGEGAWNAIRASWTHEKLVTKGPEKMLAEMRKMEASGSGQEFIGTMYGDPSGQTVWNNLKQIGEAFEGLQGKLGTFEQSSLANAPSAATAGRDLAYGIALPGHPITKVGAIFRTLRGPKINDLTQWAAYTPQRTQWLIRALTGPESGLALADLSRMVFGGKGEEATPPPMPSHETVQSGPPPRPQSLSTP